MRVLLCVVALGTQKRTPSLSPAWEAPKFMSLLQQTGFSRAQGVLWGSAASPPHNVLP